MKIAIDSIDRRLEGRLRSAASNDEGGCADNGALAKGRAAAAASGNDLMRGGAVFISPPPLVGPTTERGEMTGVRDTVVR